MKHLAYMACAVLLAGCAAGVPKTAPAPGRVPAAASKAERASLSLPPGDVASATRQAAAALSGGLAVMYGLEDRETPALQFRNATARDVAERLARVADFAVAPQDGYVLLYPGGPEYETLLDMDVAAQLAPRFHEETVALEFTPATALHTVFAVMGQSLNTTLVADNVLAETRTGLLSLPPMPLPQALKAVLQSARIDPAVLAVESTDDYIFVHVPAAPGPRDLLLNRPSLTAADRALLARRISLTLPEIPSDRQQMRHFAGARPLGAVLPALSAQLGVEVYAPPRVREIPVNPVAMNGVTVETALNLLIRQWPLPIFGYEMRDGTVLIRQRPELSGVWGAE